MKKIELVKIASHLFKHDEKNPARMEIYQVTDHKHLLDEINHTFTKQTQEVIDQTQAKMKQEEIKRKNELKKLNRRR